MLKQLPPATYEALRPPAGPDYTFFESAGEHPFDPRQTDLDLANAWWLSDAAFLAYSPEDVVRATYARLGVGPDRLRWFSGLKTTQCYVLDFDDWILLAFRGTQIDHFWESVVDWSFDFRIALVPDGRGHLVHAGFNDAVNDVWADVEKHLLSLQGQRGDRPLWITGHSLGAALATVAASRCAAHADQLGLHTTYTFGSPRVGDTPFARDIPGQVFRWQNNSDIVTSVPLPFIYAHAGHREFIDNAGHLHTELETAEEQMLQAARTAINVNAVHQVAGVLQQRTRDVVLPAFLADHAPINYSILIWNCYERAGRR